MGDRTTSLNPICWAVSGTYEGDKYDGINVVPLLEQEKIVFTITKDNGELKQIDDVSFPAKDQTSEMFVKIMRQVVGKRLLVLL